MNHLFLALIVAVAFQAAPTPEERVAALKQSLQENQARLRAYEWIETTIISLKGEEKARKQQRCYYGADGKVQKIAIGESPQAAPAPSGGRGGRLKKKIVENKKDEMQDYMEEAAGLIHQYVPPNPALIKTAKEGGKLAMTQPQPGLLRLEFRDYLLAGDRFAIDVNGAAMSLAAVNVATYVGKPDDAVILDVRFASLPDGTSYSAQTTLDAKSKNIRVVIQNSGHRPATK